MKKFLPVVFCSLAAISYSQLTLAGDDVKGSAGAGASSSADVRTPSEIGPSDKPTANESKQTGQIRKDAESSSGAGSTSAPGSKDAATSSDGTSGARPADSSSSPSAPAVSGSTSGSASGSTSESATTK